MKALKLSLGVVVIFAGGWVGASWYAGKLLEPRLTVYATRITELANKAIDDSPLKQFIGNKQLDLSLRQTERGIFSSVVEGEINVAGTKIPFTYDVEHGPFPISLLKQAIIQPKLAYMKIRVPKKNVMINMLKTYVVGDRQPFEITTIIGYDDQLTNKAVIAPLKVSEKSIHLISDEIFLFTELSPINDLSFGLLYKKLDIQENNGIDQVLLQLDNFSVTSETATKNNFPATNSAILLSQFKMAYKGKNVSADNIAYHVSRRQEQKTPLFSILEDLVIKNIKVNEVKLADIKAKFKTEHIDADYKDKLRSLSFSSENNADLIELIAGFQKNKSTFTISELELANEKGKITFDGTVQLNKLTKEEVENIINKGDNPLKLINSGSYHFFADIDAIKYLFQFTPDDAVVDVDTMSQTLMQQIDEWEKTHFMVKKDNTIRSELSFTSPDKFTLNGKAMTEQDIKAIFNVPAPAEEQPSTEGEGKEASKDGAASPL